MYVLVCVPASSAEKRRKPWVVDCGHLALPATADAFAGHPAGERHTVGKSKGKDRERGRVRSCARGQERRRAVRRLRSVVVLGILEEGLPLSVGGVGLGEHLRGDIGEM